jgi:hypothetical protein
MTNRDAKLEERNIMARLFTEDLGSPIPPGRNTHSAADEFERNILRIALSSYEEIQKLIRSARTKALE